MERQNDPPEHVNRREFGRTLAVGTAGLAAVGMSGRARGLADEQAPPAPAAGEQDAQPAAEQPHELRPVEDLLLDIVRQRYPHEQLDAEVLKAIRDDLQGVVARGELLRRFPLKNSDEPAFVFSAWRAPAP